MPRHHRLYLPAFLLIMATLIMVALIMATALASAQESPGLTGLPDSIRKEVVSPGAVPQGRYTQAAIWPATGKEYSHGSGREVDDVDALGGKAWEARVGVDSTRQMLLYGPYADLPAGDYVAFVRIERLEDTDEESVADLDASVSFGMETLNRIELNQADLPLRKYVEAPLAFRHPGGKLEVRIAWKGYVPIRVDRVTLFQIQGASLQALLHRAPQPTPSGLPKEIVPIEEPRPFPDIFPRSGPPARELEVVDLTKQSPTWQLLLLSLEGLVNRNRPEIYALTNDTDSFWLDRMRQKGWIAGFHTVADPQELLRRHRDRFKGVVITDPALPATKNVATMLAGVDDALVASPAIATKLGLPVIEDLRGRWHTSVEAYRWAFDTLWPRLNHHVISCSYPEHLELRDYLVENRVFCFWISGPIDGARPYASPDAEVRLMEQLLAKMPANMPVMSYPWAGPDLGIGEGAGVTLFAEFGKYLVGSVESSNLSVHSGLRLGPFHQHHVVPPALARDKIYVSWIMSDGDNLPVLTLSNFPQLWKSPVRGTLPIGWTISPSAPLLIPDVVDYYYSTATDADAFVGAVSGIGYAYPDSYGARFRQPYRDRVFDGFLDQTARHMKPLDLSDAWITGITRPELIRRYAEKIPSLDALFPDYGRRVAGYDQAVYPTAHNVPVFHAVTNWSETASREQQIASLVSQIRAMTPHDRPAFLHLFIWNWGADLPLLQEVTRRLGPDYVAVRPEALAALYRQEMAQEQVLVRAPTTATAIQDLPLQLTATLQDVSAKPMDVAVSVPAGLDNGSIQPARAALIPGTPVSISLSGTPSGDPIRIKVEGAGLSRETTISVRQVPTDEIAGDLSSLLRTAAGTKMSRLTFVGHFNATDLPHRLGKAEPDAQATTGQAWVAREAAENGTYILFGPYTPLPAGRYLALFRLKRLGDGDGPTATVDTCVGGGDPITASRSITAQQLSLDRYRSFPLLFTHPGGLVETRVQWSGKIPIAIDGIDLWQITAP